MYFVKEEEKIKVKVLDYHFHSKSSLNLPHSFHQISSFSPPWISRLQKRKRKRRWRCLITTFTLNHLWIFRNQIMKFHPFHPPGLVVCEREREVEDGSAWLPLSLWFISESPTMYSANAICFIPLYCRREGFKFVLYMFLLATNPVVSLIYFNLCIICVFPLSSYERLWCF